VAEGLSKKPIFTLRLGNELKKKGEKRRSPHQHVGVCTGVQNIVVVVQKTVEFIIN
jgi:hypothetical protein